MATRGTLDSGETIDYAFGLSHGIRHGRPTVSHSGSSWGFRAHLVRYPEQELSVVVLCNVDEASPDALAGKVSELFLRRLRVGVRAKRSRGYRRVHAGHRKSTELPVHPALNGGCHR